MKSGVYEIVCNPTGKRYVGSAVDFEKRWKAHRFHLCKGTHHSRHMQSAWLKHGAEAFEFRKIIICAKDQALMYEQIAMNALKPEFNTSPTAGSMLGVKFSDEVRAKMAASKMGNQHTLGFRHRPETIEMLRARQTGVPSPTKGTRRAAATVEAVAAAHRGMKRSDETKERIRQKALGRTRSLESVERGAAKLRGKTLSAERVAKMIGNKNAAGRVQTPEEKARRAESVRAAWAARKAAGIPWRA